MPPSGKKAGQNNNAITAANTAAIINIAAANAAAANTAAATITATTTYNSYY
ncbi:hypothetical protein F5Y09DRAFT_349451 [Xylaria sp. FL1042]|nr:hypothetical protein F5Y09DRAFT_349451 [Xylaria sp. FL1042]